MATPEAQVKARNRMNAMWSLYARKRDERLRVLESRVAEQARMLANLTATINAGDVSGTARHPLDTERP